MARDESKGSVSGRTQIHRLYEGDGGAKTDIGGMTHEERAAKYRHDMGPELDAEVAEARSALVAKLQSVGGGGRPDTKFDRWYDPEEWGPKGVYIGEGPCVKAPKPEPGVMEAATKAAKAKALLVAAENRAGVKHVEALPAETAPTKKRGRPAKGAGK